MGGGRGLERWCPKFGLRPLSTLARDDSPLAANTNVFEHVTEIATQRGLVIRVAPAADEELLRRVLTLLG